jgi:hypothetical protein
MLKAAVDDGAQKLGTKHEITEAAAVDTRIVALKFRKIS